MAARDGKRLLLYSCSVVYADGGGGGDAPTGAMCIVLSPQHRHHRRRRRRRHASFTLFVSRTINLLSSLLSSPTRAHNERHFYVIIIHLNGIVFISIRFILTSTALNKKNQWFRDFFIGFPVLSEHNKRPWCILFLFFNFFPSVNKISDQQKDGSRSDRRQLFLFHSSAFLNDEFCLVDARSIEMCTFSRWSTVFRMIVEKNWKLRFIIHCHYSKNNSQRDLTFFTALWRWYNLQKFWLFLHH